MITIEKLEASLIEVRRFIKAAEAAKKAIKIQGWYGSKETGAARRASLDLTRSLSALRARDA